jgi:hypothetical protein
MFRSAQHDNSSIFARGLLKKDELVEVEQGIWYELDELGLKARNFFVPLWYKSDKNS